MILKIKHWFFITFYLPSHLGSGEDEDTGYDWYNEDNNNNNNNNNNQYVDPAYVDPPNSNNNNFDHVNNWNHNANIDLSKVKECLHRQHRQESKKNINKYKYIALSQ